MDVGVLLVWGVACLAIAMAVSAYLLARERNRGFDAGFKSAVEQNAKVAADVYERHKNEVKFFVDRWERDQKKLEQIRGVLADSHASGD